MYHLYKFLTLIPVYGTSGYLQWKFIERLASVLVDDSVVNWQNIRPQNSKGADLKYERPEKSVAEFGQNFQKKGQNF